MTEQVIATEQAEVEGYDVTLRHVRSLVRRQVPWDADSRDEYRESWKWSAPSEREGFVIATPFDYETRDEAVGAARRRLWIDRHLRGADHALTRDEYEARCRAAGLEPRSDEELRGAGYAMIYGNYWMPHYSPEQTVAGELAQRRYRGITEQGDSDGSPVVDALAIETTVGGYSFKPDASVAPAGARCGVCGTARALAWISGAGQVLCVNHQDDY